MKKILDIIMEPQDILLEEKKQIKGGFNTEPITCSTGTVKCKDGDDKSDSLTVW